MTDFNDVYSVIGGFLARIASGQISRAKLTFGHLIKSRVRVHLDLRRDNETFVVRMAPAPNGEQCADFVSSDLRRLAARIAAEIPEGLRGAISRGGPGTVPVITVKNLTCYDTNGKPLITWYIACSEGVMLGSGAVGLAANDVPVAGECTVTGVIGSGINTAAAHLLKRTGNAVRIQVASWDQSAIMEVSIDRGDDGVYRAVVTAETGLTADSEPFECKSIRLMDVGTALMRLLAMHFARRPFARVCVTPISNGQEFAPLSGDSQDVKFKRVLRAII